METINFSKADFCLPKMPRSGRCVNSKTDDPIVKTSINIPESLQTKLKVLSAERRVRQSALLIEAIEDLLSKYGK